jgi:hypothetical protein
VALDMDDLLEFLEAESENEQSKMSLTSASFSLQMGLSKMSLTSASFSLQMG